MNFFITFIAIVSQAFDQNEESKAKKYVTLINETIPLYMNKFENTVGENKGYFVNGKVMLISLTKNLKYVLK